MRRNVLTALFVVTFGFCAGGAQASTDFIASLQEPLAVQSQFKSTDDLGVRLDTVKILETSSSDPAKRYVGCYHRKVSSTEEHIYVATSPDLFTWTRRGELTRSGSQGTQCTMAGYGGSYFVAYEESEQCREGTTKRCIRLLNYPTLETLLAGSPYIDHILRLLNPGTSCEGTPNFFGTPNFQTIDIGFHYNAAGCVSGFDRQSRGLVTGFGTTDGWTLNPDSQAGCDTQLTNPPNNVAGNHGDRDAGTYNGVGWRLYEGQGITNDFGSWRIYATSNGCTGPLTKLNITTPGSSSSFANPTFTALTLPNGRPGVVVTLFLPTEGNPTISERGQLIYWFETNPPPPTNTSPPSLSGSAQVGRVLTARPGAWTGARPIAYAYAWRRCDQAGGACTNIPGTAATYTVNSADVGRTLRVAVTATTEAGSGSATSSQTLPVLATGVVPVIAAAGDIACDPADVDFNMGLGTPNACRQLATSDLLTGRNLSAVLALGDNQYDCGGAGGWPQSYDPSWGRLKNITRPVPGNHEYDTFGATGCNPVNNDAAAYFSYFGPVAGEPGKGYYSFDLGAWHLVALNSNCAKIGGCGAGSPEEEWLRRDLAASTARCTLAYWHHPLFSSGEHAPGSGSVKPLFQALYDHGVEVLLVGHDHNYERFAPQAPSGSLDLARGVRQFIVGTGGKSLYAQGAPLPNSEVRNSGSFGALELTLRLASYDWQFVPESGSGFQDSGSQACGSPPHDTTRPSAPTGVTGIPVSGTRVDLGWTAANDNIGVTRYEIYRNGSLLASTNSATTSYTDAAASPSTTYSYIVRGRDAANNLSFASNVATVTTASAGTVAFAAQADARVEEASPGVNYGTSYLRADGGIAPDVDSYLRFNVGGMPGTVQAAKLRVYAYSGTADGPAVYSSADGWTEAGITWANRPARTSGPTDDKGAVAANTWVEYDVTPLVGGNGTYNFVIATQSQDGVDIYSREAINPPLLIVTAG